MVSPRLIQLVVAFIGLTTTSAAPPLRMPALGPRIPSHSKHVEVLSVRSAEPDASLLAVATCLDPDQVIAFNDENVAQLSICGSIAGAIRHCEGSPKETEGEYRTAKFTVTTVDEFATIDIAKDRWVQCIQAARHACPTGSLSAVCVGGASTGDLAFTLESPFVGEL